MKRIALAFAVSLAIAACQPSNPPAPPAVSVTAAKPAAAKPENGAWGIDLSNMDASIKPGDDFYSYVNGKWNQRTEIPADKQEVGGLNTLQDKALEQTKALLDAAVADTKAAPGSETRKLADWYASYLDVDAIEKAGFAPIKPELDAIGAVTNRDQLVKLFAKNHGALGLRPLSIAMDFDRNVKDTARPSIDISGLTLGAREFHLEPAYAPVRELQRAHIARLLKVAGFDDTEARAERMQDLESKIASITWSSVEQRDDLKKNNVMTVEELSRVAPGIDWPSFLATAGVDAPEKVILLTPSSVKAMVDLINNQPIEAWQDYMRYLTVAGASNYLPKAARDEMFEFLGKELRGMQEPEPRWRDAIFDLGGTGRPLSDGLSKRYVERYVPADAQTKAKAMSDNLLAAFDARLAKVAWMAPETRAGAREKLSKVTLKTIYPEIWNNVDALEVVRGDPVGNARQASAFKWRQDLANMKQYPDRRMFFQPVYLVNAYANAAWNEIVFLGAIVQPPAFDPAADDAVNYGAMGAIIGHEISHLFDDRGRASDGDGLLRDWWTSEDAKRFTASAKRLQDQVGAYEPIPGKKVNGALTLGESIADLGGLNVAYDAYKRSLGGKEAPVLDGLTGDQRFFMSFAQVWRWKGRDAAVDQQLKNDPHPPSSIRANTVRNMDAWYDAFNVQPGDKLYLKPEDRVQLW
jgi:putative endopeptidase